MAVPLLKGDLKEPRGFNRSQIQNLLGFFGSVENGPRQRLLMKVCLLDILSKIPDQLECMHLCMYSFQDLKLCIYSVQEL